MIFSKVKIYGAALVAAVLSALMIAVRVLSAQKARLKAKNKQLSGRNEHLTEVLEADIEIDEQTDVYLADVNKEIKDKGYTTSLSEPNKKQDDD